MPRDISQRCWLLNDRSTCTDINISTSPATESSTEVIWDPCTQGEFGRSQVIDYHLVQGNTGSKKLCRQSHSSWTESIPNFKSITCQFALCVLLSTKLHKFTRLHSNMDSSAEPGRLQPDRVHASVSIGEGQNLPIPQGPSSIDKAVVVPDSLEAVGVHQPSWSKPTAEDMDVPRITRWAIVRDLHGVLRNAINKALIALEHADIPVGARSSSIKQSVRMTWEITQRSEFAVCVWSLQICHLLWAVHPPRQPCTELEISNPPHLSNQSRATLHK
jgi:hypothetical protein